MIWISWLVIVILGLTLAVAGLTCLILWYEIGSGPELDVLRRQSGGHVGRWMWRSLVTSAASQVLSLVLYPAFLLPRLWLPRPDRYDEAPGAPAVLMVHGIFHTSSAWMFASRRFGRLGLPRCHVWSYRSFAQDFDAVVDTLDQRIRALLEAEPDRPVALVGHSMGGLVIRAWLNRTHTGTGEDPRRSLAAVVTLGAPHQGSRLAWLGATRMARQLAYRGKLVQSIEAAEAQGPPPCPCLSLRTPVDNMVLPPEGSRIRARKGAPGWIEEDTAPVSHIWLLYHAPAMDRAARFILDAAGDRGKAA